MGLWSNNRREKNLSSDNIKISIALLLAALMVRLIGLKSMPEIQADEGLWTICTKNFLWSGNWLNDQSTHFLLSPVFHLLSLIGFYCWGPSIFAARLLSALAGAGSTYLLFRIILALDHRKDVALIAAMFFGFSASTVTMSRLALIEATQLFFVLLALYLLIINISWRTIVSGLVMGIALLTKINSGIFIGIVCFFILFNNHVGEANKNIKLSKIALKKGTLFIVVSCGIGLLVYWALFLHFREQFMPAFKYEIDGVHFEAISKPIVRLGRFGIEPSRISQTILALFHGTPYLMVLSTIGLVFGLRKLRQGAILFAPWCIAGTAFFLFQMYQPLKYFYLVAPAYAYFAAIPIIVLTDNQKKRRTIILVLMSIMMCFEVGHLVMVSRGEKVKQVHQWVISNTNRYEKIMAASYLCIDYQNPSYAFYKFARSENELLENIKKLDIDYVIYDSGEWPDSLGNALKSHFLRVQHWKFGDVYQIKHTALPQTDP
jgi:4-amino-4-deoxy-L-arabinose transferase-like glycosyltransferase